MSATLRFLIARVVPVYLAVGCAGGRPAAPRVATPLPPPCAANDTVYHITPADSARGLYAAHPTDILLPPRAFRGSAVVRLVVDPHGRVVRDSIRIEPAPGTFGAATLTEGLAAYRFKPATLGACAVSSWWTLVLRR